MNNFNYLMLFEITYHPLIIATLNIIVVLSILSISFQIYKSSSGDTVFQFISINLIFLFILIFFFQFIYYFNFAPRFNGKLIFYIISTIGIFLFFKNFIVFRKLRINTSKNTLFIFLFLFLYFLISLSTVTDIDSIDYHLGIPLEWYRNEKFLPRYDWLHFRGAGSGEVLNLFGLHFGSDNFGQVIQFCGLIIIYFSTRAYLKNEESFPFMILVLSCPLLIFLTSTQKYQLFTSSLIYFSLILVLINNTKYKNLYLFTIISIICFAITIKVNYLIPGLFLYLICIKSAWENKKIKNLLFFSIVAFIFFSFPHFYKNFIFYGDPFSPIFEKYKLNPDPVILEFVRLETNFNYTKEDNFFSKFLKLFFTLEPGNISRAIGIGFLPIFFITLKNLKKDTKIIFYFIILVFFSYLFLFIGMGRYYLDVYLASCLLISIFWDELKYKRLFKFLIICQTVVVFLSILYGTITLSPSIISTSLNKAIKSKTAEGYHLFDQVDDLLPNDSVLYIINSRSYSFIPRKFISSQYSNVAKSIGKEKNFEEIIKKNQITHIISKNKNFTSSCTFKRFQHEISTHRSSRNPFNSRKKTFFFIHKVDMERC